MAIIIETKPAAQKNCQAKACRVEQLTLDWEDRRKPRQRVVTDQGTEVVLALPRGTVLAEGDCLYQDDDLTIEVHAKAQMVLKITPRIIWATGTARLKYWRTAHLRPSKTNLLKSG